MTDIPAHPSPNASGTARGALESTGVLLVNLGTPAAPTPKAVRQYLAEFLSDQRVVDYPRALWLPLLYGVILNTRPAKTARAYRSIWRNDTGESPLRYFTRRLAEKLAETLSPIITIDWAMRYGQPSIAARIAALSAGGARRILIVPLYPQYSMTTTASVEDAVRAARAAAPEVEFKMAPSYFEEPAYIEALARRTRAEVAGLSFEPERVIMSFHGLPERLIAAGDPYLDHCGRTAEALRAAMAWSDVFAPLAFQSRFGPEKWLGPSTVNEIARAAEEGLKRIAVVTPGFAADCIETLEEIGIAGREKFMEHGGESYAAIPCLNDSPEATTLLKTLILNAAGDWISEAAATTRKTQ